MKNPDHGVWAAWFLMATFYFYQYALRSSPAVMMPEISKAFRLSASATATLVSLFYYGYSWFSLIAGATLDRVGARRVIPVGALAVGVGALLFGTGSFSAASAGRFLQGAGGAFSFVGAVFIANTGFPPAKAATLVGATQMFGMAGGAAGQFMVGPLVASGLSWNSFWTAMGLAGLFIGFLLFLLLPKENFARGCKGPAQNTWKGFGLVFRNPQSILCGMIAGFLFIPTTIFDMMWGVRFLQEAHGFDYAAAVIRSATVPFGWIIGCPLLGWVSDRLGRRKPVIFAGACVTFLCLWCILYGRPGVFPPYLVGFLTGISSGGAMIPYTVIKEANPPGLSGTATGVVNFLNLTLTAVLGPVFGKLLQHVSAATAPGLEHYRAAFQPMLLGVGFALVLTIALKETGRVASDVRITSESL